MSEDCDVSLVLTWYCVSTVSALIVKMYQVSNILDNKKKGGLGKFNTHSICFSQQTTASAGMYNYTLLKSLLSSSQKANSSHP
jgi:hypothetical protein